MASLKKEITHIEGYNGCYGATLKKLPLWGDESMEINFEWPTEEEWKWMDPCLSITSIEFSSKARNDYLLASVLVNYSDGD